MRLSPRGERQRQAHREDSQPDPALYDRSVIGSANQCCGGYAPGRRSTHPGVAGNRAFTEPQTSDQRVPELVING